MIADNIPDTMTPPIVTALTIAGSVSSIQLGWVAPVGTATGGSPITKYYLQKNSGFESSFESAITVSGTTYTFGSLI